MFGLKRKKLLEEQLVRYETEYASFRLVSIEVLNRLDVLVNQRRESKGQATAFFRINLNVDGISKHIQERMDAIIDIFSDMENSSELDKIKGWFEEICISLAITHNSKTKKSFKSISDTEEHIKTLTAYKELACELCDIVKKMTESVAWLTEYFNGILIKCKSIITGFANMNTLGSGEKLLLVELCETIEFIGHFLILSPAVLIDNNCVINTEETDNAYKNFKNWSMNKAIRKNDYK